MPAYLVRGFKWNRQEIRVYTVLQDIDDVAPDWVMGPASSAALITSFHDNVPDLEEENVNLKLVEQYDEFDTGENGIAQPFAFVVDQFVRIGLSVDVEEAMRIAEGGGPPGSVSMPDQSSRAKTKGKAKGVMRSKVRETIAEEQTPEEIAAMAGKRQKQKAAFEKLRDLLQKNEKIGWYVVWCGDEVRWVNKEGVLNPPSKLSVEGPDLTSQLSAMSTEDVGETSKRDKGKRRLFHGKGKGKGKA